MKTTIIIPTYNERENIAELCERIFKSNPVDVAIIFIDDNSPDGTAAEIKQLAEKYPIELIERPDKLGLGTAYIAGFRHALDVGAELIFEMDADLSHAPEDIPRLIGAIESGADVSIGSRKIPGGKIEGWSWCRHLMSNGAMCAARLFLGLKTRDVTAGFRCYRREVLEKIYLSTIQSNGYAFQEEMLWRVEKKNFKITEVSVTFHDRKAGQSKLSGRDIFEFFRVMIKLRQSGQSS
jgi:dolichol-phosphate mannosyltransferase